MLAGEWVLATDLFESEAFYGIAPVVFAETPAAAEAAFLADRTGARKDVDRMMRSLFQPEILSLKEALKVCKKPRSGEAVYAYKLANLAAIDDPEPGSGYAKRVPEPGQPASGTSGPASKKQRVEAASESGSNTFKL